MCILKKKAVVAVLAVLLVALAIVLSVLVFNPKDAENGNSLSVEDLSKYVRQDLTNIEIIDVLTERSDGALQTGGEDNNGTVLCIKLKATDEQLKEIINNVSMSDLSVSPGDLRIFEKNGIQTGNIEKVGVSWSEYEAKKLFSTTYKPYVMDWYFLNAESAEDYNAVVITVLPFEI